MREATRNVILDILINNVCMAARERRASAEPERDNTSACIHIRDITVHIHTAPRDLHDNSSF